MISSIYWDPKPEVFFLPGIHWPILWYGLFFALGFVVGFFLFVALLVRYFHLRDPSLQPLFLKKRALAIADRLTLYVVIGTIAGARLGHFFFYERPSEYFANLWEIFRIWEGGLASHGAVLGIFLALVFFRYRVRREEPDLGVVRLLDFLCVPAAFAAFCIRVGNFFNQEILGTPSTLPWAVVFGHPADRSPPLPRHPAQLYEAFFYLAFFFFLWRLSHSKKFLQARGRLIGLFLMGTFAFRFLIEFLKEEQSHLWAPSALTMGQILSLPCILAGFLLYFFSLKRDNEGSIFR